jgi:hypothetical protein
VGYSTFTVEILMTDAGAGLEPSPKKVGYNRDSDLEWWCSDSACGNMLAGPGTAMETRGEIEAVSEEYFEDNGWRNAQSIEVSGSVGV